MSQLYDRKMHTRENSNSDARVVWLGVHPDGSTRVMINSALRIDAGRFVVLATPRRHAAATEQLPLSRLLRLCIDSLPPLSLTKELACSVKAMRQLVVSACGYRSIDPPRLVARTTATWSA